MTVIVAARRTAVAPVGGAFAALSFHDLAAPVIRACLADAGLDAQQVNEVIVGNALGAGGNPARLCALAAGLPERVAGLSIDRQCVSGLDAILLADALIRAGMAEIVLAGGTESTSLRPIRAQTFPDGRAPVPYDQAAFTPWPDRDPDMASAAATLADQYGITRAEQDAWSVESHAKAMKAHDRLHHEIVPVAGLTQDAFSRHLTPKVCNRAPTLHGTITAANTAVAADAAAFVLLVSDKVARQISSPPIRIVGGRTLGGQPDMPGLAPIAAMQDVLGAANLTASDIAVAEVMEAYAAQAIVCIRGGGLDPARVNISGGALARGHPIGASGAINAVRLYHELQNCGGTGLTAIAAAGGIGTALLLRS